MKWYNIACEQCGWHAEMIDEKAANKFRRVKYCGDCKNAGRPASAFKITETVTSTRRAGQ